MLRHAHPAAACDWQLAGYDPQLRAQQLTEAGEDLTVRQCPECFGVFETAQVCPYCAHVLPVEDRIPRWKAGELRKIEEEEIEAQRLKERAEERGEKTLDDWLRIARERGYKPGWAYQRAQGSATEAAALMKERTIQRKILVALSQEFADRGVFWQNDTGVAKSMDGKRTIRFGLPGSPDIIGSLDGRWIGIEVKTATGKQREAQAKFQAAIERAGGLYLIARSPEEALAGIREQVSCAARNA